LLVLATSVAIAAATLGLSAAPAAAEMPPWPPPAPTPPFLNPPFNSAGQPQPPSAGPGATSAPAPAGAPAPASAPAPAAAPGVVGSTTLKVGSSGAAVSALQQQLKNLAYDPGAIDGRYGGATQFAVFAFQKVQGLKVTGAATPDVLSALNAPKGPPVLSGGGDRVEVDLGRQLLMAYRGGRLVLISHISSGSGRSYCENGHCGTAITPRGSFTILWSRSGWETAPLGRLYNPQYFTTAGHAIHGATSVPLYPASHGCVRIPMHTAAWFPTIVSKGTPVIVQ
jgi:lipoprotein-anchoring transpeptidase ErfK/SrfK